MKKRKNIITVAIDSPAAAGAGTQAKLIARHYNLYYLDTGKCYRFIGNLRLNNSEKFSYSLIKKKINKLKMKDLGNKKLLNNEVAVSASIIAKDKKIRDNVHKFQRKCAYFPPKKYSGSVLDGRDIITVQVKDAMFKFFITASLETRAKRRFKEFKKTNKKISLKEVENAIKLRNLTDTKRKNSPLRIPKGAVIVDTSKLGKKQMLDKISKIV